MAVTVASNVVRLTANGDNWNGPPAGSAIKTSLIIFSLYSPTAMASPLNFGIKDGAGNILTQFWVPTSTVSWNNQLALESFWLQNGVTFFTSGGPVNGASAMNECYIYLY